MHPDSSRSAELRHSDGTTRALVERRRHASPIQLQSATADSLDEVLMVFGVRAPPWRRVLSTCVTHKESPR